MNYLFIYISIKVYPKIASSLILTLSILLFQSINFLLFLALFLKAVAKVISFFILAKLFESFFKINSKALPSISPNHLSNSAMPQKAVAKIQLFCQYPNFGRKNLSDFLI